MINSITIIGPFATEYSLAKVNRALALALTKKFPKIKVKLWADNDNSDRLPEKQEYDRYPFLKDLFSSELGNPDVVIYNNFPKSQYAPYGFDKLPGKIKLAYLAWEESIFPKRWVSECNQYLHGLLVTSEHTKQIFKNSGIAIPMFVIPEGLDIPFATPESIAINTKKSFKFLHNSSGQYRKGVDVLLKAYFAEFSANDDVALVLKLFPNSSLDKEIDRLVYSAPATAPEVVMIKDGNVSDGQLRSLYENAQAVVLPSRAEGFGIPMAEAMQLGKPLITTGFSGQMDFCTSSNAFLIDYKLVPSQSHLNIPGAKVAEPDQQSLQKQMRYVFENLSSEAVINKTAMAKTRASELTWENTATMIVPVIEKISKLTGLKQKTMAVVTTRNSRCGIAQYSEDLYTDITACFKNFIFYANSDISDRTAPDADNVKRVWQYGEMDFKNLEAMLSNDNPDILHFQYNSSFYSPLLMGEFIKEHHQQMTLFVTLHSVIPSLQQAISLLNYAKTVFVHSKEDYDQLYAWGASNVKIIEHGLSSFKDEPKALLRSRIGLVNEPIIASHGLIHDKKGLLETLKAIKELLPKYPKLMYLAINAVNPNNSTSSGVYKQMQQYIKENELEEHVLLISEFLPTAEVIKLLHLSDLIVLAYGEIKEGASGAVRTSMGSKRPLLITNSSIFHDLPVGIRVADNAPEKLSSALDKLLSDQKELETQKALICDYNRDHNWDTVKLEHLSLLQD